MDKQPIDNSQKAPDISSLVLARGAHDSPEQGMCLLEAVAFISRETFSDRPACVDVALAAFGRSFNDNLRDDERQLLKPLIPMLVGTRGSIDLTRRRAYLLVDRHLRSILPAFFRELPHKPRPDLAELFEALPPIVDGQSATRARDLARKVRDEVRSHLPPGWKPYAAAAYAADAAYAAAAAYAADAAYDAAYAAADAADAAAAAAAADAAAAAAAAAAYAAYAAYAYAADAAAAASWKQLRQRTVELSIAAFRDAIELAA